MMQQPDARPDRTTAGRRRLGTELVVLERWSEGASQAERNVVHRALFALADGEAAHAFPTWSDAARPGVLTVCCRPELHLTVVLAEDSFDVVHVGEPQSAEGERH